VYYTKPIVLFLVLVCNWDKIKYVMGIKGAVLGDLFLNLIMGDTKRG